MNRRQWLNAASMAALAALAQSAGAAQEHHSQGGAPASHAKLVAAASDCVAKGQVCLAHCIRLLSAGDDSMSDCAKSINQMLAICGALQNLAAQGAALIPAMARVAEQGCSECAEACKPHVRHHAECKACHDACLACIEQCKALS